MANEGILLIVALGALVLSGGLGKPKKPATVAGSGTWAPGVPMPVDRTDAPAFDIAAYIETLFADTATVPEQPPVSFFTPRPVVVSSSGVPGFTQTAPELVTPTTKVQIGGAGGETITASAQAVKRQEQIDNQRFDWAANVQVPPTQDIRTINRVEEMRQRVSAQQIMAANKKRQAQQRALMVESTRLAQEAIANPQSPLDYYQPTIGFDEGFGGFINTTGVAGQDIIISSDTEEIDVDFSPDYSESFTISGGMDSPGGFQGEDMDDPGPEYYAASAPPGPVDYGYGAYYGGAEDE